MDTAKVREVSPTEYNEAKRLFESRGISDENGKLVEVIKHDATILLTRIDRIMPASPTPEQRRLVALAKTHLEETVMWAVKACSREGG